MVEELTLQAPLVLPEQGATVVQVAVGADDGGRRSLTVYSRRADTPEAPWSRNASGVLRGGDGTAAGFDLSVWPPEGAEAVELGELYPRLARVGYGYGEVFQGLRAVWRRGRSCTPRPRCPRARGPPPGRTGCTPPCSTPCST